MSPPHRDADATADGAITPVVWLLGKVQSGKTSVIRALTGAADAEIGSGFRPCTRRSVIFDFPANAPVIRFLDTRGLGEAGYDPSEDMRFCEQRAHLVVVTMRAMDQAQDAIVAALRAVRERHPGWPVVAAQTTLHEGYPPGAQHQLPYPFDAQGVTGRAVPPRLARSLAQQRSRFGQLPGRAPVRFVPIDFTRPEDGLAPSDYGREALEAAITDVAPLALAAALAGDEIRSRDELARQAHASIVRHALAAAAGDLVPVAGAVAVPGIQASMLRALGILHGVTWDRRTTLELAGALGTGTVVAQLGGFGLRELAKLVPFWGQTVGAAAASAASFAATYALGKAAHYWLGRRHLGSSAGDGVVEAYRAALAEAFGMARRTPPGDAASPDGGRGR